MIIEVTELHITEGQAGNCNHCPIALAIDPFFPKHTIAVAGRSINFHPIKMSDEIITWYAPVEVNRWVCAFDIHGHTEPFTFELPFDSETIKDY